MLINSIESVGISNLSTGCVLTNLVKIYPNMLQKEIHFMSIMSTHSGGMPFANKLRTSVQYFNHGI